MFLTRHNVYQSISRQATDSPIHVSCAFFQSAEEALDKPFHVSIYEVHSVLTLANEPSPLLRVTACVPSVRSNVLRSDIRCCSLRSGRGLEVSKALSKSSAGYAGESSNSLWVG